MPPEDPIQHPFGDRTELLGAEEEQRPFRPRLRWQDASGPHEQIVDEPMTLGAAKEANVVVTDPAVSRLHLELDPRTDGLWIRDLGSKNGTLLDGVFVERARVGESSQIRLGGTTIAVTYRQDEAPEPIWGADFFGPLRGGSYRMRRLYSRIAAAAAADFTVLVNGETGTGKELVARALREASPRARFPLLTVDCGALPEHLLEAELFGHAKGAFTGAARARVGLLEEASGGSVFLDEPRRVTMMTTTPCSRRTGR